MSNNSLEHRKSISDEEMVKYIKEFKACDKPKTFLGFLLYIGMSYDTYEKLKGTGREIADFYKMELEVEMLEILRYQNQEKGFDYKYIEFLLKRSNPQAFGEVRRQISIKGNKKEDLELPNISGITFKQEQSND